MLFTGLNNEDAFGALGRRREQLDSCDRTAGNAPRTLIWQTYQQHRCGAPLRASPHRSGRPSGHPSSADAAQASPPAPASPPLQEARGALDFIRSPRRFFRSSGASRSSSCDRGVASSCEGGRSGAPQVLERLRGAPASSHPRRRRTIARTRARSAAMPHASFNRGPEGDVLLDVRELCGHQSRAAPERQRGPRLSNF